MTTKPLPTWARLLPQIVVGLVVLGVVVFLGYDGHLSPADTYAGILSIVGLVGATGVYVLASQFDNVNAIPHLVVGVALIIAVAILGAHNTFNSGQLLGLLALIITGTAGGAGATLVNSPTTSGTTPIS